MDLASVGGGAQLARVAHGLGVLLDQLGQADAARQALERSLAIWRELGDAKQQARDLNSLGIVHRHLGDLDGARALLVARSGNTALLINTLELAAGIMAGLDDPLRAARLAGAADAFRQESGMLITEPEATMLEEFLAPARASVTPQEWDAELAAGRALSESEALALLRSLSAAHDAPA
jgi:tetratricopeptide (TPR) repeat protein